MFDFDSLGTNSSTVMDYNLPNSNKMNVVFSLKKLAYDACSVLECKWCMKNCPMLVEDLQQCCTDLIEFMKIGKFSDPDHINRIGRDAARYGHFKCLNIALDNGLSINDFIYYSNDIMCHLILDPLELENELFNMLRDMAFEILNS